MGQIPNGVIAEPKLAKFIFSDTRFSWVWLILRIYVGFEWFMAGWGKLGQDVWTGEKSGIALKGFLTGALAKTTGEHPDVSGWYADLIRNIAIPHAALISHIVVYSEIAIGICLVLGLFTGIAAFLGSTLNMNFLFSGAVSMNPILLLVQLFLILAWRTAGWVGLDRYLLPKLGTPWQPGSAFRK